MTDIERLRKLLNLTQETFASKLGVSSRTIQNWEAGKVIPKSKLTLLREMAAKFPNEAFSLFEVSDSPGAGYGNEVGISSEDLKRVLDEISNLRKDYMAELSRKDSQIDRLLTLLENKTSNKSEK